jgi:hypothetical protein
VAKLAARCADMKKKSGVKRMFGGGNPGMGMGRGMFGVNRGGFEARDVKPAAPAATTPAPTQSSAMNTASALEQSKANLPQNLQNSATNAGSPTGMPSTATSSAAPSLPSGVNPLGGIGLTPSSTTQTASTPIPSNLINTTNSIASAVGSPSPFSSSAKMKKGGKVASKKPAKSSKSSPKSSKSVPMKYVRGGGIESRGKTRGRFV